ncbi:MAG TPA: hypothetical protein VMT55_02440 [Candidatus Sulfotelmatobacter sp.]|nr:hypothetical protein [Candidatus Sulfotelmatobacter sp.]
MANFYKPTFMGPSTRKPIYYSNRRSSFSLGRSREIPRHAQRVAYQASATFTDIDVRVKTSGTQAGLRSYAVNLDGQRYMFDLAAAGQSSGMSSEFSGYPRFTVGDSNGRFHPMSKAEKQMAHDRIKKLCQATSPTDPKYLLLTELMAETERAFK